MGGREPKVWLDKACIDQGNIQQDLRCLPMFLNGCRKMVVLCGVTYLRRLWCVMELFTFVHIGGDEDDIQLSLLLREGRQEADKEEMLELIEEFDADLCECQSNDDKERMLVIIHTAYGRLENFNRAVRKILAKAFARHFPEI